MHTLSKRVLTYGPLLLCVFLFCIACSHAQKSTVHIDTAQTPQADSEAGFVETAQAGEPAQTLFLRLGGMKTLTAFANRFVEALEKTPQITQNPNVAAAFAKDQTRFKDQLAIQLCELSDGPCHYKGKSMKEAHAGFEISNAQWHTMAQIFIKVLREVGVQKTERMQLAARVARLKPDIVNHD